MEGVRSPAQVFALVIGATLTVAGIVGFFYNASFATGDGTARDAVLGVLDVNGWHNLFHIASGGIGLVVAGSYGARAPTRSSWARSTSWWRCSASWPATATRSST